MNYKDTEQHYQVKELQGSARAKPEQRGEARSDSLGSTYGSSSKTQKVTNKQKEKLSLTQNNAYLFQDNLRKIIHSNHEKGSDHRLCSCGVVPVTQFMKEIGDSGVKIESPVVLRRDKTGTSFSGLAKCDNPFYCPVCAPIVLIDKSNEIKNITDNFLNESDSNTALMITFTLAHKKGDKLKDLIKVLTTINSKIKAGRFRKELNENYSFFSAIRAIESTYSDINGWHPHLHEIWYFKKSFTVNDVLNLKKKLHKKYITLLEKEGFTASELRGIDISFSCTEGTEIKKYSTSTELPTNKAQKVSSSSSAALYVSKFDKELTFEFTKIQKLTNLSFFGILARYSYEHNESDKALILEFITAVYRQRRIFVPKQMKEYLIVEEVENLEEVEAKRPIIFTFSREQWLQICFSKNRQTIIQVSNNRKYTDEMVVKFIEAILEQPRIQIPPEEYKFLMQSRIKDITEWDWALTA